MSWMCEKHNDRAIHEVTHFLVFLGSAEILVKF